MSTFLTANLILQKTKLDNLRNVRKLNVCGAQVSHIHVLRDAINAEVLSLSVNLIEDLSPLSFLGGLRELYLRKNRINDLMQVLHLSQLDSLEVLGLSENPISDDPSYRPFVIAAIPSLRRLDDLDITASERRSAEGEFSEVRSWPPPDPIPAALVGTSTPSISANASPNRGETPLRGGGAQTARRPAPAMAATMSNMGGHHQQQRGSEDDHNARVPATARRPSGSTSAYPLVSPAGAGGGGGGWDDMPVGGGRPKTAAKPPPLQQQPQLQQQAGPSRSPPIQSLQPQRGGGGTLHRDPYAAGDVSPMVPPLRRMSEVFANSPTLDRMGGGGGNSPNHPQHHQQRHHMQQPSNNNNAANFAHGAVEEGILRAIRSLVDQLSPQAAAEVSRYAASRS